MSAGRTAWGVALAAVSALEVYGIKHPQTDFTFSELTRWIFRTDRPAGRLAFVLSCAGLVGWFVKHILTSPGSSLAPERT